MPEYESKTPWFEVVGPVFCFSFMAHIWNYGAGTRTSSKARDMEIKEPEFRCISSVCRSHPSPILRMDTWIPLSPPPPSPSTLPKTRRAVTAIIRLRSMRPLRLKSFKHAVTDTGRNTHSNTTPNTITFIAEVDCEWWPNASKSVTDQQQTTSTPLNQLKSRPSNNSNSTPPSNSLGFMSKFTISPTMSISFF